MTRRLHVSRLAAEVEVELDPAEAHHARDVLRLSAGDAVELFDAAGATAAGEVARCDRRGVAVRVTGPIAPPPAGRPVVVASAVPKADRADWLVEKLSELGVAAWRPLRTARSVVHPEGAKLDRWRRIAVEAAKQSRRVGVMRIEPLATLSDVLAEAEGPRVVLSTRAGATPLAGASQTPATLLVGPEGGWTDDELSQMRDAGVVEASLTSTVLRIETAAVVAAAVVLCSAVQTQ